MYMYYIINYTKCRYLNISSTLNTYHSKSYVFLYPWYSKTTNSKANFTTLEIGTKSTTIISNT